MADDTHPEALPTPPDDAGSPAPGVPPSETAPATPPPEVPASDPQPAVPVASDPPAAETPHETEIAEAAAGQDPALPEEVESPAVGESPAPSPEVAAETARKAAEAARRPALIVRYGAMGMLGRFAYTLDRWRRDQRVVIKSDRGMEIGTIVCRATDADAHASLKMRGEVLRVVTHVDEIEERHLQESADREFAFCKQCVAERKMPMKLISVEHLFGGDRIIFYFISESRVDFRALVRDLAHEFQTRIEMRQIGVRDEARLLGDYERCGRPLCCREWIKDLEPVSMKMAKVQKATLDPAKISGRCGRLMCCLRYEHATYRELSKSLPRKNTLVGTTEGRGKVVATDVVTQMVGVLLEKGTRVNVPVESLLPPDAVPAPRGTESQPAVQAEAKVAAPVPAPRAGKPKPPSAPAPQGGTADAPQADKAGTGDEQPARTGRRRRRRSKRGGRGRSRQGDGGGQAGGSGPAGQGPKPGPGNASSPPGAQGT